MTQEDKQLLLQDLCARLPYGVKYKDRIEGGIHVLSLNIIHHYERFIPYLRPMSSMTEEEKEEYRKVCELDTEILVNYSMNGEPFPALYNSQDWLNAHHDWLNAHHFDYRGLIEKGLAIEAPKEMYN